MCMSVHAKLLRNTANYGNYSITGVGRRHTPPHETTNWSLIKLIELVHLCFLLISHWTIV